MKTIFFLTLYSTLILSSLSAFGQNSPFNVNSTGGQSSVSLTSSVGYGTLFKLERFGSAGNFFAMETGAGSNDDLRLYVNGGWSSPLVSFTTNGSVGINNPSPSTLLDIKTGSSPQLYLSTSRTFTESRNWGMGTNFNLEGDFVLLESTSYSTNPSVSRLVISSGGNVGIGTTNPGSYKLAVEGKIGAREVNVTTASWSDYVLRPDYNLRPLSEVQQFIAKNNHLPDVPSEAEVLANGQDLGAMNAILLRKIEELTLYVIELKSQMENHDFMLGSIIDQH